jgi:hypothetical protein
MGEGDTRLIVRPLRMLAFYICSLVADSVSVGSRIVAKAVMKPSGIYVVSSGGHHIELKTSSFQNLLPTRPRVYDSRVGIAVEVLRESHQAKTIIFNRMDEISQVLDFYFAKTLAPAVVVSHDAVFINKLVALVGVQKDVHMISGVDPKFYKMTVCMTQAIRQTYETIFSSMDEARLLR